MRVYVVAGTTESGDEWSMVFGHSPTAEEIIEAIDRDPWLSEEREAGCIQGWIVDEHEVIE